MSHTPSSYYLIGCRALWRELYFCAAHSRNRIEVAFLPQGLHNTPERLRAELHRMVSETDDSWEAILFGYGLCCNGIVGLSHPNKPLVIPRGHDCATLLLGSKEAYSQYFNAHPGTFWYSSGWIDETEMPGPQMDERYRQRYTAKYGEENAEFLMQESMRWRANYRYATFIEWPMEGMEKYERYTRDCANYLGWSFDCVKGDPGLLQRLMDGPWNDNEFLVVPPGHQIAASYDEGIIRAEPVADGENVTVSAP